MSKLSAKDFEKICTLSLGPASNWIEAEDLMELLIKIQECNYKIKNPKLDLEDIFKQEYPEEYLLWKMGHE